MDQQYLSIKKIGKEKEQGKENREKWKSNGNGRRKGKKEWEVERKELKLYETNAAGPQVKKGKKERKWKGG